MNSGRGVRVMDDGRVKGEKIKGVGARAETQAEGSNVKLTPASVLRVWG